MKTRDILEAPRLTDAEIIVVTMRDCGKTYQVIGDELNFSRQRAEQVHKSALSKLKKQQNGGD